MMATPLWSPVRWVERVPDFREWLLAHSGVLPEFTAKSREGDIWLLKHEGRPCFVVKRWTPDLWTYGGRAYDLRTRLVAANLPVPRPLGWGIDEEGRHVLATAYAGDRPRQVGRAQVEAFAELLAVIHETPVADLGFGPAPDREQLIAYLLRRYFAGVADFSDLASILRWALENLPPTEPTLIHGDYHLGNIVADERGPAVLDWSEATLGDWRYDLAWAGLLAHVYTGCWARDLLLTGYGAARGYVLDTTLVPHEVLAGVRWLILARTAPCPVPPHWVEAVTAFVRDRLPDTLRLVLERDSVVRVLPHQS